MQNLNLVPILPEIFLLCVAGLILLIAPFMRDEGGNFAHKFSVLSLLGLSVWFVAQTNDTNAHYLFANMYVTDVMAQILKACAMLALALTLMYSKQYLADRDLLRADFYALVLFAGLGQCVMISGNNLLTLYLGLELLALSTYALVGMRRHSGATSEAAIKYFILGALASGFLLYGMSMLYGATGSLDLGEILKAVSSGRINKLILVFGLVFLVSGLAFKLGAVPFHMWVPDVYQGSPTAITLLIAGAPKLAAFAMVFRLLVEGLLPLAFDWQQMLVVLSVLSLIVGNVTAIAQTNLKRMLAYSTISHMGFLLLGLLSGVVGHTANAATAASAYSAAMFYAITYVFTTLASFGVILLLSRQGFEAEELTDLKGLNKKSPWFAFLMLLVMFSLAGVPPMAGFYAKLAVLQAVVDSGMYWLAVVAVMASLIGAFYYLRVVKLMYFDAPDSEAPIEARGTLRLFLSINGLALLLFGIFPSGLMDMCLQAIKQTLAS